MMKYFLTLCVLVVSTTASYAMTAVEFKSPYAFATSEVQRNGAVFFTIENNMDDALKITGAMSNVAEKVELHTHSMDGDMMMMREVESYDTPAKGTTTLEPMGHHIMLMGLTQQLNIGDHFDVILKSEKRGDLTVKVEVIAPGTRPVKPEPANDGKIY